MSMGAYMRSINAFRQPFLCSIMPPAPSHSAFPPSPAFPYQAEPQLRPSLERHRDQRLNAMRHMRNGSAFVDQTQGSLMS